MSDDKLNDRNWIIGGVDDELEGYKILTEAYAKNEDGDFRQYIATVYELKDALFIIRAVNEYQKDRAPSPAVAMLIKIAKAVAEAEGDEKINEIDVALDEPDAQGHDRQWLQGYTKAALAAVEAEMKRRGV